MTAQDRRAAEEIFNRITDMDANRKERAQAFEILCGFLQKARAEERERCLLVAWERICDPTDRAATCNAIRALPESEG